MSNLLIKRDTMTDQVERHLEHAIITGELKPMSRMNSVRNLAETFGVSHKVISFAFDRLEKKKLIIRKDRSGVFVSELASAPDVTEVLVLVFGHNPNRSHFAKIVCDVVSSTSAWGRFNFFTRYVTMQHDKLIDQDYHYQCLDAEIAKLSKQIHPEVTLIIGPRFGRDEVKRCLDLPSPVLFIGDFVDGDYNDLEYNRLGTSHNYFSAPLHLARKRKMKKVVLLSANDLKRGQYLETACRLFREESESLGIKTTIIPVDHTHSSDSGKVHEGLNCALKELEKCERPDLLVFDHLTELTYFTDKIKKSRCYDNENAVEMIAIQCEGASSIKTQQVTRQSINSFHSHICELMEQIKAGTLINYKEQYSLEQEISI